MEMARGTLPEQNTKQKPYFEKFKQFLLTERGAAKVWEASLEDDMAVIDLYARFTLPIGSAESSYQVKVDFMWHSTGNLAIETAKIWPKGTPKEQLANLSWFAKLHSVFWLIYIEPHSGRIVYFNPNEFYERVLEQMTFGLRSFVAKNDGVRPYECLGVLVPFEALHDIVAFDYKGVLK